MASKARGDTVALASRFQEQTLIIRVLIADDSAAIRGSLTSLLNPQDGFQVVGHARDRMEAVEQAQELLPDVVIMDAQMPNMDGVEAIRRIKQTTLGVGILLFSVFADYTEEGIAAGADGYLMKDCELGELFAELKRIANTAAPGS